MPSLLKSRGFILIAGLAAIVLIALADRSLANGIPLALVYLAPVVAMSTVLKRWQIGVLGVLCAAVAELSDAYPWTVGQGIPRDALYFFAYTTAGLYVSEVVSRRRAELVHVSALETEIDARREVEEQLRLVVANSSIAIVTADEGGTILNANEAAERLFRGSEDGPTSGPIEPDRRWGTGLQGRPLGEFMPSLARVQIRQEGWEHLRTMMQCQGFRAGKEPFLADVWFSSYMTSGGGRLTAMIVDSSLEVRDREEANLEQVLVGSRLAIGAVSHEIRNICAAIAVVEQNLSHGDSARLAGPREDLLALRQLVAALERIASVELSLVKRQATKLRLESFLRDLYIIVHGSLREAGVELEWQIAPGLPDVWADPQSLLQVFLNLFRNAESALAGRDAGRLSVWARAAGGGVQITIADNGPGVAHPEQLFQPFLPLASAGGKSGLGLYLSRAMMLSFHGDLRFVPCEAGAEFVVEMSAVEAEA
jgi:signal transduction histidine kinase